MRDEYNEQVVKRLHHATKTTTHARLTSRAFGIDARERASPPLINISPAYGLRASAKLPLVCYVRV
jgi:hypothetical protein